MIKEAFISFDTAKLMKEKGFDEPCPYFYRFDRNEIYSGTAFTNTQIGDKFYNAPTQQMAMRWIREVHNIAIEPYAAAYRFGFTLSKIPTGSHILNEADVYPNDEFETWEDAIEAALKHVLTKMI